MPLIYNKKLKIFSQKLRSQQTDAENILWYFLRRKQIKEIQFYRQKPIGGYIVDFYAPSVRLVIEIDGSQHFTESYIDRDKKRDTYLNSLGLSVLRFDNFQVLQSRSEVLDVIYKVIEERKSLC